MSACAGACKQCTLATGWKCENRGDGTGCGGGRTCMGGVCAKKGAGVACMDGGECQSGSCVGGHCCANTCAGPPCRACTAATNWQCRNLPDETACGMAGRVCRAGICVAQCPVGNILCDGACVNPRTDPKHCGGCRTSCPSGTCMNGSCGSGPDNCPGQQLRCGGMCINPNRNDQHCGGCNQPCRAPTPDCRQGKCEAARGPLPLPSLPL
jgi:hypothetical protein